MLEAFLVATEHAAPPLAATRQFYSAKPRGLTLEGARVLRTSPPNFVIFASSKAALLFEFSLDCVSFPFPLTVEIYQTHHAPQVVVVYATCAGKRIHA